MYLFPFHYCFSETCRAPILENLPKLGKNREDGHPQVCNHYSCQDSQFPEKAKIVATYVLKREAVNLACKTLVLHTVDSYRPNSLSCHDAVQLLL
jgi:hypothetical protein